METKKRGRPKGVFSRDDIPQKESPTKFVRESTDSYTKIKTRWSYDYSITTKGPVSTEFFYPSDYESIGEIEEKLPITKRTFWNPETESLVSYGRAQQLGLVKKNKK